MHGFGDDESEVVREAVCKPLMPVRRGIGMSECGRHPDFAIAHLDRAARYIVRPEVKGAAALQIEASVLPMAGQDAVLNSASPKREADVGAPIVEGKDAPAVVDDEDWTMATLHNEPPLRLQFFKASDEHELVIRCIHVQTPSICPFMDVADMSCPWKISILSCKTRKARSSVRADSILSRGGDRSEARPVVDKCMGFRGQLSGQLRPFAFAVRWSLNRLLYSNNGPTGHGRRNTAQSLT